VDIAIGQTTKYLYRRAGQEVPVDAKIIGIEGKRITIEFASPRDGRLIVRVLRSARERVRLVDLPAPRPGAPAGNRNAVKNGQKRVGLTISLSGKRLHRVCQRLEKEGRPNTRRELRQLGYRAIDAFLSER
jgi:hypothetical protein